MYYTVAQLAAEYCLRLSFLLTKFIHPTEIATRKDTDIYIGKLAPNTYKLILKKNPEQYVYT